MLEYKLKMFLKNFPKRWYCTPTPADVSKTLAIEKFKRKAISVSICGVDNPAGEYLAFLLKQNPLVSHLYLLGDKAPGIAADLDSMDTRTMISGYTEADIEKVVKKAELVVMLGSGKHKCQESTAEAQFHREYERVIHVARVCTMYAAKSIIYVCVDPVSYMVPLVSAVFRRTHWYHPGRIIGSVALHQVRLNSLLGSYYSLDPAGINVPVVGGPDLDCLVPLFSRATPVGCGLADADLLTKRFRGIEDTGDVFKAVRATAYDGHALPRARAIARSVTAVALGVLGDPEANAAGHVRSNVFDTCSYLTTTIQMGAGGVVHNYGVPVLTRTELVLLEKALLMMKEREEAVAKVLEGFDEKKIEIPGA